MKNNTNTKWQRTCEFVAQSSGQGRRPSAEAAFRHHEWCPSAQSTMVYCWTVAISDVGGAGTLAATPPI